MAGRAVRAWRCGASVLAVSFAACIGTTVDTPAAPVTEEVAAAPEPEPSGELSPAEAPPSEDITNSQSDPQPTQSDPQPTPDEPLGVRIADRTLVVYAAPDSSADVRGSIRARHAFHVYELVEGPNCRGEGWGRLASGGFACLNHATPTEQSPTVLPVVPEGKLVPFVYAKPRKQADGTRATVGRWRSRRAYRQGKEPIDQLIPDGSYAFVRRRGGKTPMYVDHRKRAVPAAQMRRFSPSKFVGRDLLERPLEQGQSIAWTRRRETEIVDAPGRTPKRVSSPIYHAELTVRSESIHLHKTTWYEVIDTGHGIEGFIRARDVRVWTPPPPEASVADHEVWIDVELERQTLTLMRGQTPIFATLISSGKSSDPTPTGLFRIYSKKAWDEMSSSEGADDPYYVEAVPWAQYFFRDFALHTSYWHNMFGNRASHGCVNLSPRDGARIYAATTPEAPPGWLSVREHADHTGTTVRVRKGDRPVVDRRKPLTPL